MSPQIELVDVCKTYRVGQEINPTLKQMITQFKKRKIHYEKFEALKDVSFSVEAGENLGIIGDNGSGKSTILKVIAGITAPNSGVVHVNGPVAALLEVGTGFHPDMTGRENIYLNASILGIPRKVIQERIPSIIEFSELEYFIDVPVKYYSSGMYLRLGFAVAIHVDAEILIVDEILAVGDEKFQHRCKDWLSNLRKSGKTMVFVSHDMNSVRELCTRVILLEKGKIAMDGPTQDVLDVYEGKNFAQLKKSGFAKEMMYVNRIGNRDLIIKDVRCLHPDGSLAEEIQTGDPVTVEINYEIKKEIEEPYFNLLFTDLQGAYVSSLQSELPDDCRFEKGEGRILVKIDSFLCVPGSYSMMLFAAPTNYRGSYLKWKEKCYDYKMSVGVLRVSPSPKYPQQYGFSAMPLSWEKPS